MTEIKSKLDLWPSYSLIDLLIVLMHTRNLMSCLLTRFFSQSRLCTSQNCGDFNAWINLLFNLISLVVITSLENFLAGQEFESARTFFYDYNI